MLLMFLLLVLIDLVKPGIVCEAIDSTKTLFRKEKLLITSEGDTLIYNKTTRLYETKR